MYYELYVDSLFLINFIMNLCLLYLTDRSVGRTATRPRLLAGGAVGAFCFLIPFFCRGNILLRVCAGATAGLAAMILLTFRVKRIGAFARIAGKLTKYTFLLGGGVLFFENILGRLGAGPDTSISVIIVGILLTWALASRIDKRNEEHVCEAVLKNKGKSIRVRALIDSGNSLVEPISKKAASVLDKSAFVELYDETEAFRAVPFHSVGRAHGMLKGYFLEELLIDRGGIQKSYRNVCIAVGDDDVFNEEDSEGRIRLIINPEVFKA